MKLQCEILSPVHIGSGQQIDPLHYIITDGKLYTIAFDRFVAGLDKATREEFEQLIDKDDLLHVRNFIAERIIPDKNTLFSAEVSPDVAKLYTSKLDDLQNQLLINLFVRSGNQPVPLFPGSSMKGAIRTAVVSELAKRKKMRIPKTYREEREFETMVLGCRDATRDPFRGLRIRDVGLDAESTIVRQVKNVSKKNGPLQPNEIQMINEVTHAELTGKPISFETEITLDDKLFATRFVSRSLSLEQVIDSCTHFYRDKMLQEHQKFFNGSMVEDISKKLLNITLDSNSFLLRLGRFSGVESVTLDKYRNPRPPGRSVLWGTSRNLAESLYPMGWIKATIC